MFSYNRLGKSADESDVEKIIQEASNTSFTDQVSQVQENVHSQIKTFSASMDEILIPDEKTVNDPLALSQQESILPRRSGLSLAVGRTSSSPNNSGEFSAFSFCFLLQSLYFIELYILSINVVNWGFCFT